MSITRNGKIARLPRTVRNQLDNHLDNGLEAEPLLAWVNGLPETQALLREKFEGKAINPQNLSEWRQGGHQDWLRNQERIELARLLAEQAQDLDEPEEGPRLTSDRLALVMTVELAAMLKQWQAGAGEPAERWRQLRELLHELAVLRRADHRAIRNEIAQKKVDREDEAMEAEEQQRWQEAHEEKIEALVQKLTHALLTGGVSPHKVLLIESEAREAFRAGKPLPQSVQELIEKQDGRPPRSKTGNLGRNPKSEIRNRWNNTSAARRAGSKEGRRPKSETRIRKKPRTRLGKASARQARTKRGEKAKGRAPQVQADPGESSSIKVDQAKNDKEKTNGTDGTNERDGGRRESSRRAGRPRSEESDQSRSKRIKVDQGENALAMVPGSNEDAEEGKGGADQSDPPNTLDRPEAKIDIAGER